MLFMALRSVSYATMEVREKPEADEAFNLVVNDIEEGFSHIWTKIELYNLYLKHDGDQHSLQTLVSKLKHNFGDDFLILSAIGVASIIAFSIYWISCLQLVDDEEGDVMWEQVRSTKS